MWVCGVTAGQVVVGQRVVANDGLLRAGGLSDDLWGSGLGMPIAGNSIGGLSNARNVWRCYTACSARCMDAHLHCP